MSDSQIWGPMRAFATKHRAVPYSDTVDLPQEMAIYCNAAGNVAAVDHNGVVQVYTVVAGQVLPIVVKRINATSTTVAGGTLIGLF